ncbi:MAG: aminoacetone oxidase family FAD-binding enzyme [candidate division Zixibacteria bacterium]|nr:aminoacetone oxidase family FAD-binding enzyme [candidate division Zixibacteria bacterium]
MTEYDIAIVGAGAAGMAAAIAAGEAASGSRLRIVIIEGARKPGAKILVSGGGRCNVTNQVVSPKDFWGGPRPTIRKVLGAFDVHHTIEWFRQLGVRLKLEPDGKYFPVTDNAQTVLDARLERVATLGIQLLPSTRVTRLTPRSDHFEIGLSQGSPISARRVIIATGGLALPKSGSDGAGMSMLQRLGHTVVPTTPALAPLILGKSPDLGGRFSEFSGASMEVRLRLRRNRRVIAELTGALLFTHFGVSGPVAMNLSRHWLRARLADERAALQVTMGSPALSSTEAADHWLIQQAAKHPRQHLATILATLFPDRFAKALAAELGDARTLAHLTREERLRLAGMLSDLPLPVTGTRDYSHAEATAGGVDLHEIDPRRMQSRKIPGLYLCGEILDVDGRIGGFNFQWAWSSGHVAGWAAVERD